MRMKVSNRFGIDFYFPHDEIFFDSASIGRIPVATLEKLNDFYKYCGGSVGKGINQPTLCSAKHIEESRDSIANFFKIEKKQISFMPSRETILINSLLGLNIPKNGRIITSTSEEHSILAPIMRSREFNATEIDYLHLKDEQDFETNFQEKICKDTRIAVFSALTTGNGIKRDWQKIAKISQDSNIVFILDISNTVGHEPLDFSTISPDIVLSSGAIGALGPQGTSFQILKNGIEENYNPVIVGGGPINSIEEKGYNLTSKNKYEPGILNQAGIVGLAKSLELLSEVGLEKIKKHEQSLRKLITKNLKDLQHIKLLDTDEVEKGPIVSFSCEILEPHDIAIILEDLKNIVVRSGALCSHLFMKDIDQNTIVRVSTHLYNTEEEVKTLTETLNSVMEEIK